MRLLPVFGGVRVAQSLIFMFSYVYCCWLSDGCFLVQKLSVCFRRMRLNGIDKQPETITETINFIFQTQNCAYTAVCIYV